MVFVKGYLLLAELFPAVSTSNGVIDIPNSIAFENSCAEVFLMLRP